MNKQAIFECCNQILLFFFSAVSNGLLAILKNTLEIEQWANRDLHSEPIENNEDRKEIQ